MFYISYYKLALRRPLLAFTLHGKRKVRMDTDPAILASPNKGRYIVPQLAGHFYVMDGTEQKHCGTYKELTEEHASIFVVLSHAVKWTYFFRSGSNRKEIDDGDKISQEQLNSLFENLRMPTLDEYEEQRKITPPPMVQDVCIELLYTLIYIHIISAKPI